MDKNVEEAIYAIIGILGAVFVVYLVFTTVIEKKEQIKEEELAGMAIDTIKQFCIIELEDKPIDTIKYYKGRCDPIWKDYCNVITVEEAMASPLCNLD